MSEKIKNAHPRVAGHCPMGCGETLSLGEGGHVTCSTVKCPDPVAVDKLLSVPPEYGHIVVFDIDGDTFTIAHPIVERLTGDLEHCPLQSYLCYLVGPPVGPGRYRVVQREVTLHNIFHPDDSPEWTFTEISGNGNEIMESGN